MLRQKYSNEMLKRFQRLANAVRGYLTGVEITTNAYKFKTNRALIKAFDLWLKGQIAKGILTPWQDQYVKSAYRSGIVNAYVAAHRKNIEAMEPDPLNKFLKEVFNTAETVQKLRQLYTRAFENLKGLTDDTAQEVRQILVKGLADGKSPRVIGKELSDKVVGMSKDRGLKIARTEVIHAHAEGQLDSFERLAIASVGAEVEWISATDPCPICAELKGSRFSIDEARGRIPAHPSCRCSWVPVV